MVAYLLLKPPFLTEFESIEDLARSLRFLKKLKDETGFVIVPKIEPAAVTSGTVLSILYHEGTYKPVSYWSVAEGIMRAHEIGLSDIIRIGGRYDMFQAERIPGIYAPNGMLNKYDFIVHSALMSFNKHHNINILLSDLEDAMAQDSFKRWEDETFRNSGRFSFLKPLSQRSGEEGKSDPRENGYLDFPQRRKKIFKALDEIEYGRTGVNDILLSLSKIRGDCMEKLPLRQFRKALINIFRANGIDIFDADIIDCYMQDNGMCRIYFKLKASKSSWPLHHLMPKAFKRPKYITDIWVLVPVGTQKIK